MFPPKTILFALDFSEPAGAMARTVRELAEHCDAEVHVVHALELEPTDSLAAKMAEMSEKLDGLIATYLGDRHVVAHLVPGEPASAIVDVARKGGMDLIMMATSGRGVFARAWLGSVTARVLHDAPCPVWTSAPQKTRPAYQDHGIQTILCAVDLSSRSSLVLETAVQAAQFWQAQVRLTHVMELSGSSTKADWTPERRHDITSAVEGQLGRLAEVAGGMPLVEVLDGAPVRKVIEAAERCHAGLIVVGRTQVVEDNGDPNSTAYGIIAGWHGPVLSV